MKEVNFVFVNPIVVGVPPHRKWTSWRPRYREGTMIRNRRSSNHLREVGLSG